MKLRSLCVWWVSFLGLGIVTPALAQHFHRAALQPLAATNTAANARPANFASKALQNYSNLPLSFEPNVGQTDPQVRFLSRSAGYALYLTDRESVLMLAPGGSKEPSLAHSKMAHRLHLRGQKFGDNHSPATAVSASILRMFLMGGNVSRIEGLDELPGKSNYFIGNDPKRWRTSIATFAKVRYREIYRGIDLIFHGNQREVEYDFVVKPGADPRRIRLKIDGASDAKVDQEGNLHFTVKSGQIEFRKPAIYQPDDGGSRHEISGRFILNSDHTIGFVTHAYNVSKTLIIDPTVDYSTYLGGSGNDQGESIAVDAHGNAFVAVNTFSANFPTTSGAVETTAPPAYSSTFGTIAVTEINPTGTAVVYSTYLGGSGSEGPNGIALDSANPPNVYLTGWTCSTDFPITQNAYLSTFPSQGPCTASAGWPAFVTKFNPAVSGTAALAYSTYLGGSVADWGFGIAVDPTGNAYVTGYTSSSNFPVTQSAFQASKNGTHDNAFVSRIDPTKSGAASLVYSTYLAGTGDSGGNGDYPSGIAVDSSGNAYVSGYTYSSNFPTTASAFMQTAPGSVVTGGSAGFIARLNTNATGVSSLIYATYFGGSTGGAPAYGDWFGGVALGPNNLVYATGATGSSDYPVTAVSFRSTPPTTSPMPETVVLSIVDTAQSGTSSLVYSSFISGNTGGSSSLYNWGYGIAVDSAGDAYFSGLVESPDFPVTQGAYQTSLKGACNAFVSELVPNGNGANDLVYSTYFGGTAATPCGWGDYSLALALDSANNAYITGGTVSTDFPVAPSNAYHTALSGTADAFVAKLSMTPKILPTPSITSLSTTSGAIGSNVTITGSNFGVKQQTSTVTFGAATALIISWSSTSIVAQVPNVGSSGSVQVAVTTRVGTSNTQAFTIGGGPNITSVSPPSGGAGTQVTITGTGFGASQGSGLTYLGTSPANIMSWSDTQIIATVAAGSTTGVARVRQGGAWSNTVVFSVPPTCP